MSAAPGSGRTAGGGTCSSESASRREASTNWRIGWRGGVATPPACPRPGRRASAAAAAFSAEARTEAGSNGRLARSRAVSTTLSVSSSKLARVRARGPLGVWTDSRISKRPLGRATTYAISGSIYPLCAHYIPTRAGGKAFHGVAPQAAEGGHVSSSVGRVLVVWVCRFTERCLGLRLSAPRRPAFGTGAANLGVVAVGQSFRDRVRYRRTRRAAERSGVA